MPICQATVVEGPYRKHLCGNKATNKIYVEDPLDRVINVCSLCHQYYLKDKDTIKLPDINHVEMLKGVLNSTRGSFIGFCYNQFELILDFKVLCRHKNWEVFMVLCAEYSDYIPGEEHDTSI